MKNISRVVLSSIVLLFIGCAEKPKSIGSSLVYPGELVKFYDTVFTAMNEVTYKVKVAYAPGFGSSNLAGKLSPSQEAIAMFRFAPSNSDTAVLKKMDTLEYAEIRLVVNYQSNITTKPLQFNVQLIKSSWSEGTFTADSLLILDPKIVSTFSDSMNYGSTISKRLDTLEFRRWINSQIDSTKEKFYGFAVSGINTGIVGFTPFNFFSTNVPRLFIKFINDGKPDSLTLRYGEDTYHAIYSPPLALNPITVNSAFGIRSKIHFDVSSLVNSPTVTKATMELTLDTMASSLSGFSPDSVIALVEISNTVTDSSSGLVAYGFRKKDTTTSNPIYAFNLRGITDRWVRNPNQNYPNYGLTLRWAAEFSTAEKAVFFISSNADAVKRPKLIIDYYKK